MQHCGLYDTQSDTLGYCLYALPFYYNVSSCTLHCAGNIFSAIHVFTKSHIDHLVCYVSFAVLEDKPTKIDLDKVSMNASLHSS